MNGEKARLLAEIIVKIKLKNADPAERALLNNWLDESEENRQTYRRIVRGVSIARWLKAEDQINRSVDFIEVRDQIVRKLVRRKRMLRTVRAGWGTAAAVAVSMFVHYWAMEKPSYELVEEISIEKTVIAAEPMMPSKAVLVMADGRQFNLEERLPDSIGSAQALIRGGGGQLSYEAKSGAGAVVEEWNKVVTSVGGEYFLILSDGTKVWLNANTQLEFPVNFVKGERSVKLAGEAYFEVAKDERKPFIVTTSGMETKVLGTSFNIKAYADEKEEFATLLSGSVEVKLSGTDTDEQPARTVLSPGMQACWEEGSRSIAVSAVNPETAVAWRNGEFFFNEEDMHVILRTLSRWYGVCFVATKEEKEKYTFSGKMRKDEKLDAILEILTMAGGPQFEVVGDSVYINGK